MNKGEYKFKSIIQLFHLLCLPHPGSAVDAVETNSSKDVRGSSGLANTGTIISYE